MRYLTISAFALFICGCATTTPNTEADLSRPSIASTQSVAFVGKTFDLKFKSQQQVVPVYEYFLPKETPELWTELVDLRIYPVNADGNEPIDHAKRTAALFKKQYPFMHYAIYSDKGTGPTLLDFFYPTSSRGDGFLEFNAFKFFRDSGSPNVISFHYAKNIQAKTNNRSDADVVAEIKKTRADVVPVMADFPLYRQ